MDGEFVAALKDNSLCWKGSSNQRVIDVKKTLAGNGEIVLHCSDHYSGEIESIATEGAVERKDCACC